MNCNFCGINLCFIYLRDYINYYLGHDSWKKEKVIDEENANHVVIEMDNITNYDTKNRMEIVEDY